VTVAGIVPAAGRSSRMGTPKPLLDAGGRSFLQAVVRSLAGGGCAPVLVVLRQETGPVAATARIAGARIVVNPDPSAGPISSLRAGIRALEAFCPVDHPLVAADTVERLVRAFRTGDAPAVVPAHGGRRGHPVIFRRSLFCELLEEGLEKGARTVLHRHLEEVEEVPVEDEGVVVDIDTLGEYRRRFPDAYRKRFQSR